MPPVLSNLHSPFVNRYPDHPVTELRFCAKAADGFEGLPDGFLHDLLGIRIVVNDGQRRQVDSPLVWPYQLLKGVGLAAACTCNEFCF